MQVTVGTFNLNNLFSRFNFAGSIQALAGGGASAAISYKFTNATTFRVRLNTRGKLVKAKAKSDTKKIAARIRMMDVDVLAVQEVEHIGILREFNREHLDGLYGHQVLIEGNDPRFIEGGCSQSFRLGR